jgi:hypothetical protein
MVHTELERLIQMTVDRTLANRLDAATERVADEMAKEILNDPTWRAQMQQLIRAAFANSVKTLSRNATKKNRTR